MSQSQPTSTPTPEVSPAVGDPKPAEAPQPAQPPSEPPKPEAQAAAPAQPPPEATKPTEPTPTSIETPPQPPQASDAAPQKQQDVPAQDNPTVQVKVGEAEIKPAEAAPELKPTENNKQTEAATPAATEATNVPVTEAKPQDSANTTAPNPETPAPQANADAQKESSQPEKTAPAVPQQQQPQPNQPEEVDEGDIDIQSLTAGILKILNEDLTADGTTNHDLLKRIADLQEFIIKLIEILKEKTMLCASLDRQNLALTHQIKSLKDVVAITKDLLTIRNMEVEHLHEDLKLLEENIQVERTRQGVAAERLGQAMKLNDQLKTEYTTQLDLFQKLRDKYNEKVVHLTKENKRLIGLMGDQPASSSAEVPQETSTAQPEVPPVQPEEVKPDGISALPEASPALPEGSPAIAEGSPAPPEGTTTGQV